MELNKKNKNLNLIFRLVAIACFIMAVIGIIGVAKTMANSESHMTYAEKYKGLFTGMKMYIGITIGTVLCAVLSIMSWKTSHYGFVILRSIFLIGLAVFMLIGFSPAVTLAKAGKVVTNFNVNDIYDLTEDQITASGYTYEELEELDDKSSDISDDDGALMTIILSYVSAAVIYFIMFFTSIASIIKVQAWYAMAASPTNSPEYYAAMRNNSQDKQLANPYAPVNSQYNNIPQPGYPDQQMNSYNNNTQQGFSYAPSNNMQQGYPNQQGFSYQPANSNMQQGYQGQPMNMGTMESQFDAMQQSGAYNNGNFSNQSYTGAPEIDDMDDV